MKKNNKANAMFNSGCTASNDNPNYITCINIKKIIQTSIVMSKLRDL